MKDVTNANFGLLIAYVLPGFVALWGVGLFSPTVRDWLGASSDQSPTVGGFLYVTLGAVGGGLFVSTLRWLLIDAIHHRTGINQPNWDFSGLNNSLPAFELLVASHYRYYQFYANLQVSAAFTFLSRAATAGLDNRRMLVDSLLFLLAEIVLWLGSRDTLRKYYVRVNRLLGNPGDEIPENRGYHGTREKSD